MWPRKEFGVDAYEWADVKENGALMAALEACVEDVRAADDKTFIRDRLLALVNVFRLDAAKARQFDLGMILASQSEQLHIPGYREMVRETEIRRVAAERSRSKTSGGSSHSSGGTVDTDGATE